LKFEVGNIVRTCTRSFDLERDRDRWHRASLDLEGLGGRMAGVLMTVGGCDTASVTAAWSDFQYVIPDAEPEVVDDGQRIDTGGRGKALCLDIASQWRELPLRIHFGDGQIRFRRFLIPDGFGTRTVWIDLKGKPTRSVLVESDSTFSIVSARKVWRGWRRQLDCDLVHHADMAIYENSRAVEKGLCLVYEKVEWADTAQPCLRLTTIGDVDSLRCGRSKILVYEPERVLVDVESDRHAIFILQDSPILVGVPTLMVER